MLTHWAGEIPFFNVNGDYLESIKGPVNEDPTGVLVTLPGDINNSVYSNMRITQCELA